jgi:hypothetical protein
MPSPPEKPARNSVEIHPYVQGKLRSIPRQEDTAGILIGTSANGVTRITGFKRVPPNALRQAADAAGPSLAGFYRLQSPNAPALQPEEEELWRQAQPQGRSLFLLLNAVNGSAEEATAWTRDGDGTPAIETVSLAKTPAPPPERTPAPAPPPTPQSTPTPEHSPAANPAITASLRIRVSRYIVDRALHARRPLAVGALAFTATLAALVTLRSLPDPPPPSLSLDLQSRSGELVVVWDHQNAPAATPSSATLTVREGKSESTVDLTRGFTASGRAVVRPRASDVVITLTLQYPGEPPLARSATYIGFSPRPPQKKAGPPRGARLPRPGASELNPKP